MATTPNSVITAQTPRFVGSTVVSASALTSRTIITGTTGLTLVVTAGSNGSRVEYVKLTGTGTSLAGIINIWVYDGTSSRNLTETLVTAITASTTVVAYEATVPLNIVIPSTHSIYFSSQVASQLVAAHASVFDL